MLSLRTPSEIENNKLYSIICIILFILLVLFGVGFILIIVMLCLGLTFNPEIFNNKYNCQIITFEKNCPYIMMNVLIENLNINKYIQIRFKNCDLKSLELLNTNQTSCYYYQDEIYFDDQEYINNNYFYEDPFILIFLILIGLFILLSCFLFIKCNCNCKIKKNKIDKLENDITNLKTLTTVLSGEINSLIIKNNEKNEEIKSLKFSINTLELSIKELSSKVHNIEQKLLIDPNIINIYPNYELNDS